MSRVADKQEPIEDEAAGWLAAIECGTADRHAFEQWRSSNPAHALAFIRLSQIDRELDCLRDSGLSDRAPSMEEIPVRPVADRRRALMFGAAGLLAAGLGAVGWSFAAAAQEAETAVGERRRIVVARGIAIELNTDSHVEWRHGDGAYDVRLLRGEVMLEHEAGGEPCRLHCGSSQIDVSSAARVNARVGAESVAVSVLEGEASLRSAGSSAPVRLASLHRAKIVSGTSPSMSAISPIEAGAVSAWQQGQLQFNGERLEEAVKEYNRYLARPIEIADPQIRQLRMGGRFSATDPADFCRALNEIYGVTVHREPDRIVLAQN